MIALEFEHVSRDFTTPDGRGYRALDDISLSITAGAFAAIVGPSGCGKSTLLNIAAGLLAPSAGAVRVEGEPLTASTGARPTCFSRTRCCRGRRCARTLRSA